MYTNQDREGTEKETLSKHGSGLLQSIYAKQKNKDGKIATQWEDNFGISWLKYLTSKLRFLKKSTFSCSGWISDIIKLQKNYSKITKKIDHKLAVLATTESGAGENVSILHSHLLNHGTPPCMKSS